MKQSKVQITMQSTQPELSDETMETVYIGHYKQLAGKHIITYDEFFEEEGTSPSKSTNLMKIDENSVQITKKGAITTKMQFEKGKKHLDMYQTPYGNFELAIQTEQLSIQITGQTIEAEISYYLSLNGAAVSKCNIHIEINGIK